MDSMQRESQLPLRSGGPYVRSLSLTHGRLVNALRLAWLVVAPLLLVLWAAGQVDLYEHFRSLASYDPAVRDTVPADVIRANLADLGVSVEVYAAYLLALGIVLSLVCFVVATIVFVRRSDEPMALFTALVLVLLGATFPGSITALGERSSLLNWLDGVLSALSVGSILLLFYLFPTGRFVPRWTRWPALLFLIVVVVTAMIPGSRLHPGNWQVEFESLVLAVMVLTGIAVQIYRYRHISDYTARQQTKWVVLAFSLALVGYTILFSLPAISPAFQPGTLADFVCRFLVIGCMLLIPMSFGIAITRYHLWDIDLVINRTLVYAPLSGMLAGLFGGLTALFQWLSVQLMGAQSIAAIVLSAFTVFGAIIPLRDFLQALVDRHFKVAPSPGERGPVSAAGKQAIVPRSMDAGMEQDGTPAYIEQLREELAALHADLASRSASEQELRQLLARLEERISSPPQEAITTSRVRPRSAAPQESAPHSHTEPGQRTLAK
jgi:hypothetical protein